MGLEKWKIVDKEEYEFAQKNICGVGGSNATTILDISRSDVINFKPSPLLLGVHKVQADIIKSLAKKGYYEEKHRDDSIMSFFESHSKKKSNIHPAVIAKSQAAMLYGTIIHTAVSHGLEVNTTKLQVPLSQGWADKMIWEGDYERIVKDVEEIKKVWSSTYDISNSASELSMLKYYDVTKNPDKDIRFKLALRCEADMFQVIDDSLVIYDLKTTSNPDYYEKTPLVHRAQLMWYASCLLEFFKGKEGTTINGVELKDFSTVKFRIITLFTNDGSVKVRELPDMDREVIEQFVSGMFSTLNFKIVREVEYIHHCIKAYEVDKESRR